MQTRQTPAESMLIAPSKLKPGQQKDRTMGQLRRGQRSRNHKQLRLCMPMQSQKAFGFNSEESHRIRAPGFGKQALTVIEGQTPGLMDTSTTNRLHRPQCLPRQGTIAGHQIVPQARVHRRTARFSCQHGRTFRRALNKSGVIVIGGGIAGLTAAALLSREGLEVTLLEAHHQVGGCAGTFRRGPWTFDVGATQVAGLEPGGSHERLLRHLGLPLPEAEILDPGCVVDLCDGTEPIPLWHDPERWAAERQRQFPGSDRFWRLCDAIHSSNWAFAGKDPIVTPRSLWDLRQLIGALQLPTLASGLLAGLSMLDLLRLCGCADDSRLRRFLDLQLKLYSQEPADRTAALYGATVLNMAQAPLGLWHLQGSMQVLSDQLVEAIEGAGGTILRRHRATGLRPSSQGWDVDVQPQNSRPKTLQTDDVVSSLPPQCLPDLIADHLLPAHYRRRLNALPEPSGALVLYGAVRREALPDHCPGHLQRGADHPGSLFVSISREGDGRAPAGQATLIASLFTPTADWCSLEEQTYQRHKHERFEAIHTALSDWLNLQPQDWLHMEMATPRGFAGWTGRPRGMVGGLGQHPSRFGPFGLAGRTPLPRLWLCGDSIHPGEGTAGVSLSALNACRQLLANRGTDLQLSG